MSSYWEWNKENFPWHYDPSSKQSDVQYVGRFIHDKMDFYVQEAIENFDGGENSSVIFNVGTKLSDGQFSIMNYCLNEKNMTFGPKFFSCNKMTITRRISHLRSWLSA